MEYLPIDVCDDIILPFLSIKDMNALHQSKVYTISKDILENTAAKIIQKYIRNKPYKAIPLIKYIEHVDYGNFPITDPCVCIIALMANSSFLPDDQEECDKMRYTLVPDCLRTTHDGWPRINVECKKSINPKMWDVTKAGDVIDIISVRGIGIYKIEINYFRHTLTKYIKCTDTDNRVLRLPVRIHNMIGYGTSVKVYAKKVNYVGSRQIFLDTKTRHEYQIRNVNSFSIVEM